MATWGSLTSPRRLSVRCAGSRESSRTNCAQKWSSPMGAPRSDVQPSVRRILSGIDAGNADRQPAAAGWVTSSHFPSLRKTPTSMVSSPAMMSSARRTSADLPAMTPSSRYHLLTSRPGNSALMRRINA